MKNFNGLAALAGGLSFGTTALAQSSVAIYGVLDLYAGYTNAQGTGSLRTLDSGGLMASRLGFRGREDLGGGLGASFVLEHGLSLDTGAPADVTRYFNRQGWVGLSGGFGEFRAGRQNTPQFYMLGAFDAFYGATYGSLLNNVSGYTPRFDNTVHYIAPTFGGVKLQAGLSLGEQAAKSTGLNAYIAAAEYQTDKLYLGVNHVEQNSLDASVKVKTTFAGGNYDYGTGRLYVGFYSGNNNGANVTTNVAGRDYRIWSLSGDYRVTPLLTLGALYGQAKDRTAANKDANEVSAIATYVLSKRTTIYSVLTRLDNKNDANFSLGAAAPIVHNVPAPGGNARGFQLGIRHLF